MLQYRTVEPATLELLIRLMQLPELEDFFLVGGTCLALRYGHRKSVDLDLFSVTITYFADAEDSADPVSLNRQTWENVKETIRQKVKEYLQ